MDHDQSYAGRFEYRPEFLFHQLIKRVVDANVDERSSQGLRIVRIEDVFANPNEVFLVFGKPNTALVIGTSDSYEKFNAYSLWRRISDVQNVTRRSGSYVQSGIWLRLLDLPAESRRRMREAMRRFEGMKFPTCVNGNMRIMDHAGFTSGRRPLSTITLPYELMRTLFVHGLFFEGRPIPFEVVRTTRLSMEDYTRSVIAAEIMTPWRHYQRTSAAMITAQMIDAVMPRFGRVSPEPPLAYEVAPSLPADFPYRNDLQVRVTSDSLLGKMLRQIWGPHALFETVVDDVEIDRYFSKALRPFPQPNPTLLTRVKKRLLFSKPVVRMLRSIMGASNFHDIGVSNERDIYNMLRTNSENAPNRYNLVIVRMPGARPKARLIIARVNVRTRFIDWILSKHVLMSGYLWHPKAGRDIPNSARPYVVWAGECWKNPDGSIMLWGNSGTYQPKAKEDDAALAMTRTLFPHLHIFLSA